MKPSQKNHTSPRKKPFWGFSVMLAFVLAVTSLVGLEWLFRQGLLDDSLPLRSHGLDNIQFDIKWFKLQEYLSVHGGVDIIFTGSSLVNTGIDPAIIQDQVLRQTGNSILFFNYGTEGLSLTATAATIRILIETARPDIIVLATEMRDYYNTSGQELADRYISNSWVQQKMGNPSVPGWLLDNSLLLQKAFVLRDWMRVDFPETLKLNIRRWHDTSESGYEPDNRIMPNIASPIDLNDPEEKALYEAYYPFDVADERLQALQDILAVCKNNEVQLVLLDMPAHPTFFGYFGGESEHGHYLDFIEGFSRENDVVLIPAMPFENVPVEGWSDRIHLNKTGVPVFSQYLGENLSSLLENGQLNIKNPGGNP